MRRPARLATAVLAIAAAGAEAAAQRHRAPAIERRDEVAHLRGPYNTALFDRHGRAFRIGASLHFAHGRQHDLLLRTPLAEHASVDADFDADCVRFAEQERARTEPTQELYAPYTARAAWRVLRAIDWTHIHHEQTYDILADADIPWHEKARWTERAVRYYLDEGRGVQFSPAPLDVTMRRAGVMTKPYFTLFRNAYPKSNDFFYAAHWWHPVLYEALMLAGNDGEQEAAVRAVADLFFRVVLEDRPQRMLLLREAAPRYSRFSPESANIFDNLHMFHGIVYDILAYEGWTIDQQRDELYRVIDAMSYREGDEDLARKFRLPRPDMDPRDYGDWLRGTDGEMTRIMLEMHEEMMPMHVPDGVAMTAELRERMTEAIRRKLEPGMQEGEVEGSLHDAMKAVMPDMKSMPEAGEPGGTARPMIEAMLRGWREKHGELPDVESMQMDGEPALPPLERASRRS